MTIQGFGAPNCAFLGETIGGQISVTLTNTGGTAIDPGTSVPIGFYVSTDSTITTSDTLLIGGRENLSPNGLGIGETITDFLFTGASISASPNPVSPTGNVFIGVLADEFDNVTESDETDNTAAQAITIEAVACAAAPDLIIQSLTHSPVDPNGAQEITFTAVVKNDGDATAAASTLCLTNDAAGEVCTDSAAKFSVPSLAAGATDTVVRTEDVAVGGPYQNLAVADIDGVVAESEENNNTAMDTYGVGSGASLMTATITSLPTLGTVFGVTVASQSTEQPVVAITTVPTDLVSTTVSYTAATTGTASFGYTITDQSTGITSAAALIDVIIGLILDTCDTHGREDVTCVAGDTEVF